MERHVGRTIAAVERDLILATLTRCAGNRTWAADLLGISAAVLRKRLIDYAARDEEVSRDAEARRAAAVDPSCADEIQPTYVPVSAFLA